MVPASKDDTPKIEIVGKPIYTSTKADLGVFMADFLLKNLSQETLKLTLLDVTCHIGEVALPIPKFVVFEDQGKYRKLNRKKIILSEGQELPIGLSFSTVEESKSPKGPITVEINIECCDSIYHGVCPITLARRIPKRKD